MVFNRDMTTPPTTTDIANLIERKRNIARDKITELEAELGQWEERKSPASGMSWTPNDERHIQKVRSNIDYWQGRRDAMNDALAFAALL
jgi:hypothetical protein